MSAAGAIAFLWIRGSRNWIRVQARRLRNPRYLVAAAAGAFYFYLLFLRHLGWGRAPGPGRGGGDPGPEALALIEAALTGGAILAVVSAWIFGGGRAVLQFTEAEVQHLFTAPLTRRAVLQIRVLKTLLRGALSAVIMTVLLRRAFGGGPVPLALGTWLSFSTLSLHGAGVSLLRESLRAHGRSGLRRWWLTLAILALAAGAVTFWAVAARRPPPPDAITLESLAGWVRELLGSAPLSYVLWPLRAPIRVMLAHDWGEMLLRLPPAVAVLGALYAWVVSSGVAFEEAAVEAASERARRLEARRGARAGIRPLTKVRSSRLPLPRRGPAWIALTWKNLITARRLAGPLLLALVLGGGLVVALSAPLGVAAGAATTAGFLAFFGPMVVTVDLRQGMAMADVLRTLPLRGRDVVLGEVMGSAVLLALAQWVLWLVASASAWGREVPGLQGARGAMLVVSAMAFGPALSFASLCVQNAGAILFPAWVAGQARLESRGLEATGQRLLTLVGTLLVLLLALLPCGLLGVAVAALASPLLGEWALVAGVVAASLALVVEGLLTVHLLGGVFDRIDLTL